MATQVDFYQRMKELQKELEFLDLQEEYIKEEQKSLKRELSRAQEVPSILSQLSARKSRESDRSLWSLVSSSSRSTTTQPLLALQPGQTTSSEFCRPLVCLCSSLSLVDRELLKPSATVALHRQSHALVDVLPPEADSTIPLLAVSSTLIHLIQRRANDQMCNTLILVASTYRSKRSERPLNCHLLTKTCTSR